MYGEPNQWGFHVTKQLPLVYYVVVHRTGFSEYAIAADRLWVRSLAVALCLAVSGWARARLPVNWWLAFVGVAALVALAGLEWSDGGYSSHPRPYGLGRLRWMLRVWLDPAYTARVIGAVVLVVVCFFDAKLVCRQDAERRRGLCPVCGYNVRADPARCSECRWERAAG